MRLHSASLSNRVATSAHSSAYARAGALRGELTTSGSRVTPINSTAAAYGMTAFATDGR
jgi:hypothetical protein